MKVSHRTISLDALEFFFKHGIEIESEIIENPVWEGAYIIHSYIDRPYRTLHLFFHDPVNGTLVEEGQDITTIPVKETVLQEIKKPFYKCGHDGNPVIMDSNPLSLSAYIEWQNSVGFEGDKSQCFECWCKERKT